MKILIVGAGGREHAIALAFAQNEQVEKVFISKHNGGASGKIVNAEIDDTDFDLLDQFIEHHGIDLTIIGPEDPLNKGIVDYLVDRGHRVFGPKKKAALLEGSKAYAKEFMQKYGVKTAAFKEYSSYEDAKLGLDSFGYPTVIKADGLCQGKGVYICENEEEALVALEEIFVDKIFADQGGKVVLEEYLKGFEASLLCFVSDTKIYPFDTAMDYKKIYEDDLGPNTGGVGAISPNPYWNNDLNEQSTQILRKIEEGLKKENMAFNGILFIGYLIQDGQIYVLEFNTRFGDPETEVLLPRLKSDLLTNINEAIDGRPVNIIFDDNHSMTTILVSKGYPKSYEKGFEITGLDEESDCIIYHNGTIKKDGRVYSNGGRVLSVVAVEASLEEARTRVYERIRSVNFENMSYRTDIGTIK